MMRDVDVAPLFVSDVVATPLTVRPPLVEPLPIVDEACEMNPAWNVWSCVQVYAVVGEKTVPPLMQTPFCAKQPLVRLSPLPKVEVAAVPVRFKYVACKPEENDDVAPELKVKALVTPLIESAATEDVALKVEVAK